MKMENTIKVARYRNTPYIFNYATNGGTKRYEWSGSKGNKIDTKTLPLEAVDWLMMNSTCFKRGELVILEETEEAKEIIENLGSDKEEYQNNTNSKEKILELLRGHHQTLQKKLKEITVDSEKKFIVDVAKEISDELTGVKLKYIAEWMGTPQDVLFD